MSTSVTNYLATHYLTADPAPTKKRKRKHAPSTADTSTLVIADDTLTGWDNAGSDASAEADNPTIVASTTATGFKKAKWKTVGAPAPSNAEADAIIAAAERDRAAERREADDAPAVVDVEMEGDGMRRSAEAAGILEKGGQETIYRDATGRVINVAMKRAEARRKAEEEERKKVEEKEAARGDVQQRLAKERKVALGAAKLLTVARGKDDDEMNRELKEVERWNDPVAKFLKRKRKTRSSTGRPLYRGSFQPNRYGIMPGHRWDGVDRSNGFEQKWFDARSQKYNREQLEYAWEIDE
jgi:pre-mRNA-splicing factor CWC26